MDLDLIPNPFILSLLQDNLCVTCAQ